MPETTNKTFAKLYTFDDIGQALAQLAQTEEGWGGVKYRIADYKGLEVEVTVGFGNDDASWDKAEKAFENVNEKNIKQIGLEINAMIKQRCG